MEKKLIIVLLILFGFNSRLYSQKDSISFKHSVYLSGHGGGYLNSLTKLDLGYQIRKGKSCLNLGISLERNHITWISYPDRHIFDYVNSNYGVRLFSPDRGFSVQPNHLMVNYSYFFKEDRKFTAFPFIGGFVSLNQAKGEFTGEIDTGVYGTEKFEVKQLHLTPVVGFGFRFKLTEHISFKQELCWGMIYEHNYYYSQYLGLATNRFNWEGTVMGRLGIYYDF